MKAAFLRLVSAFVLCLGVSGAALPAQADASAAPIGAGAAPGVSPAGLLNVDGTLALAPDSSGSLDLEGWNVTLDPARGPVFDRAQAGDGPDGPLATALGEWAGVGESVGALNSAITTIVVSGGVAYIGGSFQNAGNVPEADFVATWNGVQWGALSSNGQGDGALYSQGSVVYDLVVSGGNLYMAGYFAWIYDGSTETVSGAAHIARWDGAHWSALGSDGAGGPSITAAVYSIAVNGTDVYAAGYFTNVNNNGVVLTAADYIAKWDGTNWSALGSNGAGNGALSGGIRTLAVNGGTLYAGGEFTDVNNNGVVLTAADYVAKWDGTNWSALGSNGAGNGALVYFVATLALSGNTLYVGGTFTDVNNNGVVLAAADYIAKWDGANWSALGSNGAGNGALSGAVTKVWVNGADIYVGGAFTNVNNNGTPLPAADYLTKWDGASWSALGSDGAGNGALTGKGGGVINAFGQLGGTLLAGGYFYDLKDAGSVLPGADFIAGWNGTHWSAVGQVPNGAFANDYPYSQVNAILVNGTDVYVGGYFTNISNHGVNLPEGDFIAKWDGTNWSALGSNGAGNGSLNYGVSSLAMIGTDLYVGGSFGNVNDNGVLLLAGDYLARWDGSHWAAVSSNGSGNGALNGSVSALAVNGTTLYVGGTFTNVSDNGVVLNAADRLASWNGTHWSAVGSNGAGDGALNGSVQALTINGSTLYAGGYFTNVNDGGVVLPAADYIATWDGSHWAALGDNGAGDGALNNAVFAVAVSGSTVYAGGAFVNVNDHGSVLADADYLSQWDGSHWSVVGSNGTRLLSAVYSILAYGTGVVVGGRFAGGYNGGVFMPAEAYVARWDGTDWTALGVNGQTNPSLRSPVHALALRGTDLWVGGEFENVRNLGTTIVPEADFLATYGIQIAPPVPVVSAITRGNINPIGGDTVQYGVLFSKSVTGVDVADFTVTTTGLTGSSINSVSGSGTTYVVMVNVGTGASGTLRLDVVDNDSILDTSLQPLGGVGAGNGDFTTGQVYTIDRAYPVVSGITRVDPNPTRSDVVQFLVTFSRAVSSVDESDFAVIADGVAGATVTAVSGSGTSYTVTVSTGTGSGSLRLDLIDDDSIRDAPFNPLGGPGYLNGSFSTGESYDVRNRWVYLPLLRH